MPTDITGDHVKFWNLGKEKEYGDPGKYWDPGYGATFPPIDIASARSNWSNCVSTQFPFII